MSLDERRAKSTAWALTFADVVTLLLTFFVLLLVMLSDAEKRLSTLIEKLLDETYEEMTIGLSYDNISVDRETKGIKITITGNLFKSTSAEIDPKYYDVVHQIGQLIADSDLMNINSREEHKSLLKIIDQNNATLNVEVRCEGHTDDAKLPPNAEYPSNWELSAARSLNLVRLMNKHAGMPEKYFSALGYGEFRPVIDVSNISDFKEKQKGRAKNRRVEIYLDAFLKNKPYTEKEINI
jgi:chemotaxis protein MotB